MSDRSRLADILVAARREDTIVKLPEIPDSLDESYAVQDAIIDRMQDRVLGWKAAFTNSAAMEKMKTDEPALGPLFASYVFESGARVSTPENCARRIESEYAFKMARGLPVRPEAYTRDEVVDAVATLHPAIEIVHTRVDGGFDIGARVLVADHCVNFGFIMGDGMVKWQGLDLTGQAVTLSVDGDVAARGSGAEVMGDPVDSLTWLANKLRAQGKELKAGDVVTTGSCTGMHPVPRECELVADFGPLGQCTVTCGA